MSAAAAAFPSGKSRNKFPTRSAFTIAPETNGEFRPGEMRHLTSGTERIRAAGYQPQVDLATGHSALSRLDPRAERRARLLQRSGRYPAKQRASSIASVANVKPRLSVIIPALNEEEPIGAVVRACLRPASRMK